MNKFDEMRQAVTEAEATLRAVDTVSTDLARLLVGRLRKVSRSDYLKALKEELRKFNSHTGRWKP